MPCALSADAIAKLSRILMNSSCFSVDKSIPDSIVRISANSSFDKLLIHLIPAAIHGISKSFGEYVLECLSLSLGRKPSGSAVPHYQQFNSATHYQSCRQPLRCRLRQRRGLPPTDILTQIIVISQQFCGTSIQRPSPSSLPRPSERWAARSIRMRRRCCLRSTRWIAARMRWAFLSSTAPAGRNEG